MHEEYVGKKVQVQLIEEGPVAGRFLSGVVLDYLLADEDDEQAENELLIQGNYGLISIRESEIKTIAIME